MIATVFIANFQFQLNQLLGFREFLQSRENLIKDLSRAELEVAKALEAKAKASQSNSTSNLAKLFTKSLNELVRSFVLEFFDLAVYFNTKTYTTI